MLLTGYVRPDVEEPVTLDGAGRPVRYGGRWPDGAPPEARRVLAAVPDGWAAWPRR